VTSLEPRTPHQPGKLQKLSKNDYVFTLFIFRVNKKQRYVCGDFSMKCSQFTGWCSGVGAVFLSHDSVMSANARFNWTFWYEAVERAGNNLTAFVKISAMPRWTGRLTDFSSVDSVPDCRRERSEGFRLFA
jgi:hypothetical protein